MITWLRRKALRERGILFEQNIDVPMRDGIMLRANVFRPRSRRVAPALVSLTPHGKDNLSNWFGRMRMRTASVHFGELNTSRWTGFEAPDPLFWVDAGYALVQADLRGLHASEGNAGVLTDSDAEDYYDLIEWSAHQAWCNGTAGCLGVAYLAMLQWRVAALKPPHLKAIVPWEGGSDIYRDMAFHGGIPETRFAPSWWKFQIKRGRNRRFALAENFIQETHKHPLDDEYWDNKKPRLESIDIPALVCASWSDPNRGAFEGYSRISSADKWLFTHGGRKWEGFYAEESRQVQRRFLDCFLKGKDNGWRSMPRVRLEVRQSTDHYVIRNETHWPAFGTANQPLYLNARLGTMTLAPEAEESVAKYRATATMANDRASFQFCFQHDVEVTGEMTLKLWVSTSKGNDLDLFIVLRKLDGNGNEVYFLGYNGYPKDCVAKGWLRVSHRALDHQLSRASRPWHTHKMLEQVEPDAIVPVEIEILPSSTLFESGTILHLDVLGHDAAKYPMFAHRRLVNSGTHSIYTGGRFDSHLLVPVVPRSTEVASQGEANWIEQ